MHDGAKLTTGGDDAYVTYKSVDDLPVSKSSAPKRDKAGNTFDNYVKHEDDKSQGFYLQNAVDNAVDIHPSTFGHELIGNSLFSFLGDSLQITKPDLLKNYTMSTAVIYTNTSKTKVD
jgi:hypothetical protein